MRNETTRRVSRTCAVCGRNIKITIYPKGNCRGGHYFGKIPLHTKKAWKDALKAGTRKVKMGGQIVEVLKKDPKPYSSAEYWECPKCYWKK